MRFKVNISPKTVSQQKLTLSAPIAGIVDPHVFKGLVLFCNSKRNGFEEEEHWGTDLWDVRADRGADYTILYF